jgi:uncharacterized membrane protein
MEYYIELIAKIIEGVGIAVIFMGMLISLIQYIMSVIKKEEDSYIGFRKSLGKSILLGLEILIAADIVVTVITEPTLRSVAILAIIVLIRTFLSLSIQVEIEGRFPWQKKTSNKL